MADVISTFDDWAVSKGYETAFWGVSYEDPRTEDAHRGWKAALAYGVRTSPAEHAPSHMAVMQQALDALEALHSMQSEWHAAFPEHVGDKEAPAMQAARSAIAALSASIGQVSEPRDG